MEHPGMKLKTFSVSLFLSALLALTACSVNPVSGKKDFTLISEQQELAIGAQKHPETEKTLWQCSPASLCKRHRPGTGET